jgi:hypothetical protein
MTVPWQLQHDLIRAEQAAVTRTGRQAEHLAELRHRAQPRRRLRIPHLPRLLTLIRSDRPS